MADFLHLSGLRSYCSCSILFRRYLISFTASANHVAGQFPLLVLLGFRYARTEWSPNDINKIRTVHKKYSPEITISSRHPTMAWCCPVFFNRFLKLSAQPSGPKAEPINITRQQVEGSIRGQPLNVRLCHTVLCGRCSTELSNAKNLYIHTFRISLRLRFRLTVDVRVL